MFTAIPCPEGSVTSDVSLLSTGQLIKTSFADSKMFQDGVFDSLDTDKDIIPNSDDMGVVLTSISSFLSESSRYLKSSWLSCCL